MAYGMKICLGCGERGRWGGSGRCAPCFAEHKAKYREPEYLAERARLQDMLRLGVLLDCARCGEPITTVDELDTGHHPDGLRAEHRSCNRGKR